MSNCCPSEKKPFTQYSLVKAGKSIIKHFTDPTYNAFADVEIKDFRLSQCNSCELLTVTLGKKQCKACKCFIDAKASLIDQECPHPEGSRWIKKNE